MLLLRSSAAAVSVLAVLTACGSSTIGQTERTDSAVSATKRIDSTPAKLRFIVGFDRGQEQVLEQWGVGPTDLPSLRLASYRMLIACQGEPLKALDGAIPETSTRCDGVTLDAKVISNQGMKRLKIDRVKTTRWHIAIARTHTHRR